MSYQEHTTEGFATSSLIDFDDKKESSARVVRDPVASYLREAGRYELLKAEQEVALAHTIQAGILLSPDLSDIDTSGLSPDKAGRVEDKIHRARQARQTLILHNMRLVVPVAKKYQWALPLEDLLQEGVFGLAKAAEKFDPNLGYKFSTYGMWWVRQKIGRAVKDQALTIRVPVHIHEALGKIYKEYDESPDGDFADICRKHGMDPEGVEDIMKRKRLASLDAPLSTRSGESDSRLLEEVTPDPEDQYRRAEAKLIWGKVREALLAEYGHKGERMALVVEQRTLEQRTLDEIGEALGVSRERVRQIEKEALEFAQKWSEGRVEVAKKHSSAPAAPNPPTTSQAQPDTSLDKQRAAPQLTLTPAEVHTFLKDNSLHVSLEEAIALGYYSLGQSWREIADGMDITPRLAKELVGSGLQAIARTPQ